MVEEFAGRNDNNSGKALAQGSEGGQAQVTTPQAEKKFEKLATNDTEKISGDSKSTKQRETSPTFAILLTTYNAEDREAMYTMRLQWWLSMTELPIYVVDSAGRGFPPSLSKIRSFKQLKFDQKEVFGDRMDSTLGELLSMKHAWEAFQKDWSRFDYIVKVTGKYVLPDLQSAMQKVSKGNSFIIEHYTDHADAGHLRWVNTEFLGFNAALMGKLLEELANNKNALEDRLGQMLVTGNYLSQQLDSMKLPELYWTKRGAGDVLKSVLETSDRR